MHKNKIMREVVFELIDPAARHVVLQGSFLQWKTTGVRIMKDVLGNWRTKVWLAPGKHEYKFIVDGRWIADPTNPDKADDGHGGYNSVITIV